MHSCNMQTYACKDRRPFTHTHVREPRPAHEDPFSSDPDINPETNLQEQQTMDAVRAQAELDALALQ
jgi:hypothetical protein